MTLNQPKTRIKLALVSANQTNYDFAHNVTKNGKEAIDMAVHDRATMLLLQELFTSAYYADDNHQWYRNNEIFWPAVQYLVNYANEVAPNLIISFGVPWYYADENKSASDIEFNRERRLFNTQMLAVGGRVIAISAKSILADGPAEYEPRQFHDWPLSKGTIHITLPDGSEVPFGKPVVMFADEYGRRFTFTHEQCAEGWPGVNDDMTVNARIQHEARPIIQIAKSQDVSVVHNGSASKPQPAINKETIRMEGLCKTGSLYCGVYTYVNCLGSDSGTMANEGSMIIAQDGQIIQHGQRYSFKNLAYTSAVVELPPIRRAMPDVAVHYDFQDYPVLEKMGSEAAYDKAFARGEISAAELSYEEYLRSISLWLRDYISKPGRGTQGVVVSLSGGKDSAYGAIAVSAMIDFDIKENGVVDFFKHFKGLSYEQKALEIYRNEGESAAVKFIKENFLTCVYIATDNSSVETEEAARFLVNGGVLPNGEIVKGIGGSFIKTNIQTAVDDLIIAATGIDLDTIASKHCDELIDNRAINLSGQERIILARAKASELIRKYVNTTRDQVLTSLPEYISQYVQVPIPTWHNPSDDITLQNIQARARLPIPWTIANKIRKMPLVTSNASEGVLGYTTAGGDMSMGGANPIGGITKDEVTESLKYFATRGVFGFAPLKAVLGVLGAPITAELRKQVEGEAKQTDESDLGFSYTQSDFIEKRMITARMTPQEVMAQMQNSKLFEGYNAYQMRDTIIKFSKRWEGAQFKRIMSTISPYIGNNPDPHQSVRTPVLGDHFKTMCATMTLDVLEKTIGQDEFQKRFGMQKKQAEAAAILNGSFKLMLYNRTMDEISKPEIWLPFQAANSQVLKFTANDVPRLSSQPHSIHGKLQIQRAFQPK